MILLSALTLFILGSVVAVGGGWAVFIARSERLEEMLFVAAVTGLSGGLVSSALLIGFQQDIKWNIPIIAIFGLVGWTFRLLRRRPDSREKGSHRVAVALSTILIVVGAVVGGAYSSRSLGFEQRLLVGPDTIGNAVAVNAVASGATLKSVASDLRDQTGAKSTAEVLDSNNKLLYSVPSIQTQIRGEFLVAGLRWGLSGLAASLVAFFGPASVWLVLAALSISTLAILAIGMLAFLRRHGLDLFAATAVSVMVASNVTILHSLREGGNAQIIVLPLLIALLYSPVLTCRIAMSTMRAVTAYRGLVLAAILVTYSDMTILLIAVGVSALCLALFQSRNELQETVVQWAYSIVLSLVLVFPFAVRFGAYLPRRIADATTGGWSMRVWPGFSETIGLINSYNQASPTGVQVRSPSTGATVLMVDLFIILAVGICARKKRSVGISLLLMALIPISAVRIKAQFIDEVTNYQYFKALGCLVPVLLAGLGLTLYRCPLWERAGHNRYRRGVFLALSLASLFAAISHTNFYNSHAIRVAPEIATPNKPNRISVLDDVNFVAPLSLETMSLAPFTSGGWLGRGYFGKSERLAEAGRKQLVVLIKKSQCPRWECLSQISKSSIGKVADSLRLVKLGVTSEILRQPNSQNYLWSSAVSRVLQELGGPAIDRDFNVSM